MKTSTEMFYIIIYFRKGYKVRKHIWVLPTRKKHHTHKIRHLNLNFLSTLYLFLIIMLNNCDDQC